jgi:hypothetical protein
VNLTHALAILRSHDWGAEIAYQTSLASSGQDACAPSMAFNAGTGATLHIYPRADASAECFFIEPYHQWASSAATSFTGRWARDNVSQADQKKVLEKFFRREYVPLTQLLSPAPWPESDPVDEETPLRWDDEGGTVPRENYWAQIKDYRAKRGEQAELSPAEKELSPEDCLALWGREERLWREKQHHDTSVKSAKLGRFVGTTLAVIGTSALVLHYLEYLPDNLFGQRPLVVMMTLYGGVIAIRCYLDLRALVLRTAATERQANVSRWIVGGAMFLLSFTFLALVYSFFIAFALQTTAESLPSLKTIADAAEQV